MPTYKYGLRMTCRKKYLASFVSLAAIACFGPLQAQQIPSDLGGAIGSVPISFQEEFDAQYGLAATGADIAFSRGFTGFGVRIAIFDVAADPLHPELAGRIPTSFNMFTGTEITEGDGRHGTHVAGIAGASQGNGGMMGVAPGSEILPVAMLRNRGVSNDELEEFSEAAFDFAIANNVVVMNNSWGNSAPIILDGFREAIDEFKPNYMRGVRKAAEAGIITVRSAGNDRQSETGYYAALPYLYPELEDTWIAVVSLDQNGDKSGFSNACGVAAAWCISAPGSAIFSGIQDGGYGFLSGTSMAAPHVTGAVAIASEVFPNATGPQLRNMVLETATDIGAPGIDDVFGWGSLNIGNIVMASDPETATFYAASTWSRFETIETMQGVVPGSGFSGMEARLQFPDQEVISTRGSSSEDRPELGKGWIRGTFSKSELDRGLSQSGGRTTSSGFALGYDFISTDTLRAGFGVGASSTSLTGNRLGDVATADGVHALGYVDWRSGNWFANGVGQIAKFDQSVTRGGIIGPGGSSNPIGRSDFNVTGYALDLRGGYDFKVEEWTISPYMAASGKWQSVSSFSETGAGAFSLDSDGSSSRQLGFGPGVMFETPSVDMGNMRVKAGLDLSYMRLSGDRDNLTSMSLIGSQLDARSTSLGRDMVKVGLGVKSMSRDGRVEASLSYEGRFQKNAESHGIAANVTFRF